jgi:2-oxoglutarate ferredoxin oxidoreductase subunit beta
MVSIMKEALEHRGFSAMDIFTQCPTYFGRVNKFKTPYDLIELQQSVLVPKTKFDNMTPEQKHGKFARGIIKNEPRPTFFENYTSCIIATKKEAGL